jgi:hypothetical protein
MTDRTLAIAALAGATQIEPSASPAADAPATFITARRDSGSFMALPFAWRSRNLVRF